MRWIGTTTDIHERKLAEDELRKSEQRLRAILDNTPSIIYVKDLDGRYTLVNRTAPAPMV